MLAVLCAAFMASQFFRVSNAVIAPELMRTLSISSEAMGVITGAFFLAFGIMQIPTGCCWIGSVPGAPCPGCS